MLDMIMRQKLNREQLHRRRDRGKDYRGKNASWHTGQMDPSVTAEELTRIDKQIKQRETEQRQRFLSLQLIVMLVILVAVIILGCVAVYVWKI